MNITASLPKALIDVFEQTRERVETEFASNTRLRWLALSGALVLYLGLVLVLWNNVSDVRGQLRQKQEQLSRLESQTSETSWPERSAAAQSMAAGLEQKLWPGQTPGLAEAGFEQWIRNQLENEGVEVRQVQLTRSPVQEDRSEVSRPSLQQIQRIRAKVVAPLNEAALVRLLSSAAENPSWVLVEQLIVRGGRNERFEIDLTVFYRPPGGRS